LQSITLTSAANEFWSPLFIGLAFRFVRVDISGEPETIQTVIG